MKVSVLGSGNGGCAIAFEWASCGHEVSLFDFEEFPRMIKGIQDNDGLECKGQLEGKVSFSYVGHDIQKALEGAELIFVVGPAYSTEAFGEACKPFIEKDQTYVICPSSCFGSIVFKNAIGYSFDDESVTVAETSTLPYAVRITGDAEITIYNRLKDGVYVAALPATLTQKVYEKVSLVHNIKKASNIARTTLQNGNPTIHPAVSLLNAARIENPGDFMFYEEGVTPGVGRLMKAVDEEKLAIGKALNVEILREPEIGVEQGYMTESNYDTGYSKAPGFQGILAQEKLDNRYFHEDVGYTLVCFMDLAKVLGVDTPVMKAITLLTSIVMDKDYVEEAKRTLSTMGLGNLPKERIIEVLTS